MSFPEWFLSLSERVGEKRMDLFLKFGVRTSFPTPLKELPQFEICRVVMSKERAVPGRGSWILPSWGVRRLGRQGWTQNLEDWRRRGRRRQTQ